MAGDGRWSLVTLSLLRVKAWEVATILNGIADPDEREAAREQYEQALNDELYHGARTTRDLMAELSDNGGHSVRVQSLAEYAVWKAGLPS